MKQGRKPRSAAAGRAAVAADVSPWRGGPTGCRRPWTHVGSYGGSRLPLQGATRSWFPAGRCARFGLLQPGKSGRTTRSLAPQAFSGRAWYLRSGCRRPNTAALSRHKLPFGSAAYSFHDSFSDPHPLNAALSPPWVFRVNPLNGRVPALVTEAFMPLGQFASTWASALSSTTRAAIDRHQCRLIDMLAQTRALAELRPTADCSFRKFLSKSSCAISLA